MELRKLRRTMAVFAAAAMLLMMVSVTPAIGKGPAPKTIQFDSSQYIVWEGHPTAYDIGIGLVRSVKTGTPSVTLTIGATGDAAVADQDYSVAQTSVTVTFPRNQLRVFNAATIAALTDLDESIEGDETITLTLSSPSSKWSLGTPSTATVTIHEEPAPQAPIEMSAAPLGTSMMDVSWSMPSTWPGTSYPPGYPLTFTVERTTDGINWSWVNDVSQYYVYDSGLDPDTTYTYRVLATNADGAPVFSETFAGTTEMMTPTPTCSAAIDLDDPTVVHVTWTIPENYVGDPVYYLVYSTSAPPFWDPVAEGSEFYWVDDTGLTEVPLYYRVDAQTDNGTVESDPCSTIS